MPHTIHLFFYNLGIQSYALLIRLAALSGNKKAILWLSGRRDWKARLEQAIGANTTPLLWMHVSSLGEYEQGLPILLAYKTAYPQYKILLTFFSPSGYEIRYNTTAADYVCYLPLDTHVNAHTFLQITKPALVIFVKYDFWYHYITAVHRLQIPIVLVSAIFRADQYFFRSYARWYRDILLRFSHIFVQEEESLQLCIRGRRYSLR
jgi:3-deoxy-D-manno-octulosonic-acid transferase